MSKLSEIISTKRIVKDLINKPSSLHKGLSEDDADFPPKSANIILRIKLIITIIFLLFCLSYFSQYLPYIAPVTAHNFYWYGIFPGAIILNLGWMFYKKIKNKDKNLIKYFINRFIIVFFILFICFGLISNLIIMPTRLFAKENFDQKVFVTKILCLSHTRITRTKLTFIDEAIGKPQVLYFSSYACSYDPVFKAYVKENDFVILHGRKWWAGSYVDSIEAEGNIINIHGTKWWLEQFIEKNYLLPQKDS